MTNVEQITQLLTTERDKLSRAIEALTGGVRRRGRPPKDRASDARLMLAVNGAPKKRGRPPFTEAQRKAHSLAIKKAFAAKHKAKKE